MQKVEALAVSAYGTASAGEVNADTFVAFDSLTKDWCKARVLAGLEKTEAELQEMLDEQMDAIANPPIGQNSCWLVGMKLEQSMSPELKVALELEAHEKECAIRYQAVGDKLEGLDKRMWRLEAMIMGSTVIVVGLAASLLMKM